MPESLPVSVNRLPNRSRWLGWMASNHQWLPIQSRAGLPVPPQPSDLLLCFGVTKEDGWAGWLRTTNGSRFRVGRVYQFPHSPAIFSLLSRRRSGRDSNSRHPRGCATFPRWWVKPLPHRSYPVCLSGGFGGIRTHETLAGLLAFEASAFNHSATNPVRDSDPYLRVAHSLHDSLNSITRLLVIALNRS